MRNRWHGNIGITPSRSNGRQHGLHGCGGLGGLGSLWRQGNGRCGRGAACGRGNRCGRRLGSRLGSRSLCFGCIGGSLGFGFCNSPGFCLGKRFFCRGGLYGNSLARNLLRGGFGGGACSIALGRGGNGPNGGRRINGRIAGRADDRRTARVAGGAAARRARCCARGGARRCACGSHCNGRSAVRLRRSRISRSLTGRSRIGRRVGSRSSSLLTCGKFCCGHSHRAVGRKLGIGLRGGCHGTFIRLWRNDGHNRHAGLLTATGAHLVNPVIELGNLSI